MKTCALLFLCVFVPFFGGSMLMAFDKAWRDYMRTSRRDKNGRDYCEWIFDVTAWMNGDKWEGEYWDERI